MNGKCEYPASPLDNTPCTADAVALVSIPSAPGHQTPKQVCAYHQNIFERMVKKWYRHHAPVIAPL